MAGTRRCSSRIEPCFPLEPPRMPSTRAKGLTVIRNFSARVSGRTVAVVREWQPIRARSECGERRASNAACGGCSLTTKLCSTVIQDPSFRRDRAVRVDVRECSETCGNVQSRRENAKRTQFAPPARLRSARQGVMRDTSPRRLLPRRDFGLFLGFDQILRQSGQEELQFRLRHRGRERVSEVVLV